MERHKGKWISTFDDESLDMDIRVEMQSGLEKFGKYNSMHEAYAVIKEELEEFWDSIKNNDPDPMELIQVVATAKRAIIDLCQQARDELETNRSKQ